MEASGRVHHSTSGGRLTGIKNTFWGARRRPVGNPGIAAAPEVRTSALTVAAPHRAPPWGMMARLLPLPATHQTMELSCHSSPGWLSHFNFPNQLSNYVCQSGEHILKICEPSALNFALFIFTAGWRHES